MLDVIVNLCHTQRPIIAVIQRDLVLYRSLQVLEWLDFLMLLIVDESYGGATTTNSVGALAIISSHIVIVVVSLLFRVVFVFVGSFTLYLVVSNIILI